MRLGATSQEALEVELSREMERSHGATGFQTMSSFKR